MRRKLWLPVLLVLCLALTVGMLVACDPGSSDQGGQGGNGAPDDAPRRTVTFDLNGGSGSISPMEFAVGYAMSGLPEPTRKGYDFLGWQDINGNMYDETTKMPDQDLKLYAYWQIIVTSYSDNYVSFKPATEGVKDSGTRYDYDLIDTFIYVELTSSDLGGRGNVGDRNNFDFSKGVNIEYSAKDGYTLQWYSDSDFTVLNGAQVFTLYYGSNFQFLTVSSGQSVVKRYLVDFYVLHDYEVKLHKSIHNDGYYDTVYVVENRTFPASTEAYQLKDFEFDKRVYWNATTGEWRAFNYSTPITGDLDLYQTYKPKTVTADLDGGTLSEPLTVRPYVQYQRLPVPTKEGYDFIGWQLPDAEDDMTDYFSDITGFVSTQMLGEGGSSSGSGTYFTSLKAVWKPKQFAMLKDGDTVSFKATVPVVTYTDLTLADINEILYVPYGTDCVVPDKIDYTGGGEFRGWKTYTDDDLADDPYLTEETPPETPGEDIPPDDPVIDPGDPVIDPDDPVIDPDDPVVPGDPGTTPSQGTVVLDGDRFDFGTEVTSPIALYQVMAYNLEFTGTKLQLNDTVTLSSRMNMRALLPAKGTYTFEFTARSGGDVTFSYGGTSYHVTASSPKTVIVTNSSSTKGQVVVFTVSSLNGKVDVSMSGPTATTTGSPIDVDLAALYDLGEEITLTAPDKAGYDCIGWYDGDTRVCESGEYTFTLTGEAAFTPKYEWNNELQNFEYIERADGTVTITGVKSSVAAQLQTLVIPEYVVTINSGAFNSATNLVSIEVEEGNTAFSSAGGILYDKEQKNIVYVPAKLAGSVTLPDGLQSVKSSAFSGRSLVTSVNIPSSVTSIGTYAFEDCVAEIIWGGTPTITEIGRYAFAGYAGTSITIPSSVTSIGNYAFEDCAALTSITIPDSVTSIGSGAFSGCSSLESMTIPFVGAEADKTAEDTYQYPFGYIFGTSSYTGGTAVRQTYYGSSTSSTTSTTYYIPSSLRSVTVTDGNILRWAFYNCSMLTSVTIGNGVTSIGDDAFWGCYKLIEVYNKSSLEITAGSTANGYVGYYAKHVYTEEGGSWLSDTEDGFCFLYDGETGYLVAYYGDETELTLPDSFTAYDGTEVTSYQINDYAFYGRDDLTSVAIPDSVTSIGDYAFSNCAGLNSIHYTGDMVSWLEKTWHGNVMSSGRMLYIGGNKVEGELVIPNGIASIPSFAFAYQTGITSVTIPNSVTSIGGYAFYKCDSLTSVTIPDSVTSIGSSAFSDCAAEIIWDGTPTITAIGGYAFAGYAGTSITIPNGVTSIGDYAFSGSTTEIAWGDAPTIAAISSKAFSGYKGTSLIIPDSVEQIAKGALQNLPLESITIPFVGGKKDGTGATNFGYIFGASSYGYNDDYVPASLKEVIITGGTSIERGAFYGCSSLESLTIPFVGAEADKTAEDTYQYPFGYIFGTSSYTGGTAVKQYYYGSSTSYTTSGTYYIPSSLRSVTVTGGNILYGAFSNCSMLTSVTIPDGVTSIGYQAFSGCTSLTSVAIPDSVTSIGSYAFYGCTSLTSVTIPDSVTSIGYQAFSGCAAEIIWGDAPTITEIGGSAFAGYAGTSITIPGGVTSIGYQAFSGCAAEIIWGDAPTITEIGGSAFAGYAGTSITIPDSVTSIVSYAFSDCTGLNSIHYTGDMVSWCGITGLGVIMSSGRSLYIDGNKVEGELVIPNEIASIPSYAFAYQTGVTSVTIPDSVTSIGQSAFYNCTSLTSVTIGNSVTSIGQSAFYNCGSLTSVIIGSGVTSIGERAFNDCASLTSVTIPSSVTSIGNYAFEACAAEIIWGDAPTITEIGPLAFANYAGTSITIPDSVTSIGEDAFYNCGSLTSVTIGNSVTSIGQSAFYNCGSLTSVIIPDSVTSIGELAFGYCPSLERLTVASGNLVYHSAGNCIIETATKTLIQGCKNSVIPDDGSVTSIGEWAFAGCDSLNSITIPDSVKIIGRYAFAYCTSLASVIFEETTGWYRGLIGGTGTPESLSSSSLANPSTAAQWLTSKYNQFDWYRK